MALSTDVVLSINIRPKFPKRCVVCSGKSPDAKMSVGDFMFGWFSLFSDIPEGWGSVTVPVHARCKKPFKLRRWLTRLTYLTIAVVLWSYFGEQIEAILPEIVRRPGRKVILGVMMLPVFLIEWFNPPRFDITVAKHDVAFEFADPRYAAQFAKNNDELKRFVEIMNKINSPT